MKKNEDIKNIKFGLFDKGSSFKTILRDIRIYISRIFFIIKHGYSPVMQWEFYSWHRAMCEEFFRHNLKERYGTPVLSNEIPVVQGEKPDDVETWNNILKEMIHYLELMDENNSAYDGVSLDKTYENLEKNKELFFELFKKYYYTLWD